MTTPEPITNTEPMTNRVRLGIVGLGAQGERKDRRTRD
jgi:hypothetical protein